MKFTASVLDHIIDSLAPYSLACSWDNVGFQVGRSDRNIAAVLCALEITPAIIREAVRKKADAIISHHPLIFHPVLRITDSAVTGQLVTDIILSGLCLFVAHTNLDKSPCGTNHALAKLIGLANLRFIQPEPVQIGKPQYGMGYVGKLPKTITIKRFIEEVKRCLRVSHVQVIGDVKGRVRRVAVLAGSGNEAIKGMDMSLADVLLTGEMSHHAALEAKILGMTVICAGHYATEAVGMKYFAGFLRRHKGIQEAGVKILEAKCQSPPYEYV
ncbi:MAG: Nif3-like dinuclear metal center hexameric protein [Candidatus Sumerlaeota bacterium]|nr:Nif3-like dinuclear metal center hexameric protein [Candidatus Sumerlaeota bacterium]